MFVEFLKAEQTKAYRQTNPLKKTFSCFSELESSSCYAIAEEHTCICIQNMV